MSVRSVALHDEPLASEMSTVPVGTRGKKLLLTETVTCDTRPAITGVLSLPIESTVMAGCARTTVVVLYETVVRL